MKSHANANVSGIRNGHAPFLLSIFLLFVIVEETLESNEVQKRVYGSLRIDKTLRKAKYNMYKKDYLVFIRSIKSKTTSNQVIILKLMIKKQNGKLLRKDNVVHLIGRTLMDLTCRQQISSLFSHFFSPADDCRLTSESRELFSFFRQSPSYLRANVNRYTDGTLLI